MRTLPFAWEIRLSKRSSRPRIIINAYGKVELVWPINMPQKHVFMMLEEHKPWVLKHLATLEATKKEPLMLPTNISLSAINHRWKLIYRQQNKQKIRVVDEGSDIIIQGDLIDQEAVRYALCVWLKRKGKQYLSPWLENVATSMDLSYQSLSIRLQKKRWGSCSTAKRINLNAALLFLPEYLVLHVLIHELSHLKHLNHSASFWAEVQRFDENYIINKKQLKKHSSDVPAWVNETFA